MCRALQCDCSLAHAGDNTIHNHKVPNAKYVYSVGSLKTSLFTPTSKSNLFRSLVLITYILFHNPINNSDHTSSKDSVRIYWISSRGQKTRGGHLAWWLGEVLSTPHHKNLPCYDEPFIRASGLDCSFGRLRVLLRKHEGRRPDTDGKTALKLVVRKWNGLIRLRTGIGGGLVWIRQWTFALHKMRGISRLAENLLVSQNVSVPFS